MILVSVTFCHRRYPSSAEPLTGPAYGPGVGETRSAGSGSERRPYARGSGPGPGAEAGPVVNQREVCSVSPLTSPRAGNRVSNVALTFNGAATGDNGLGDAESAPNRRVLSPIPLKTLGAPSGPSALAAASYSATTGESAYKMRPPPLPLPRRILQIQQREGYV